LDNRKQLTVAEMRKELAPAQEGYKMADRIRADEIRRKNTATAILALDQACSTSGLDEFDRLLMQTPK